jgi:hypothetical protein
MANKLFAEVTIAGSYKNLAKSTRGATKELNIFEKNAKKISAAVSAAFAGIALAGITFLTDALIEMAKAAAEDRKSMALLNATLEKNWKATDQTIAGVSEYIDKTSLLVGIVDDDLRPAFSKIARVTKDQTKAQKAFDRVLDISAGTGKDVNLVAQAYSKYLGGNKTALDKLIPGLKDSGDRLAFIDEKYAGMAAVAGKNDPFNLMNISLGEFQEKIGTAFLPLIDKLAEWLTSDAATDAMDKFAEGVQEMFSYFSSAEGQKGMQQFLDGVTGIADAIAEAMKQFDKAKPLIDFLMWTTSVANAPLRFLGDVATNIATAASGGPGTTSGAATPGANNSAGSIVYNIYGVASGADVLKVIKGEASKKGRTVLGLLTNG